MSSVALETFLARLYTDADARRRFETDPQGEAARAGLAPAECLAMTQCDRVGLQMAAESFGHKRAKHGKPQPSLLQRMLGRLLRR
jgi:hypothetical protein